MFASYCYAGLSHVGRYLATLPPTPWSMAESRYGDAFEQVCSLWPGASHSPAEDIHPAHLGTASHLTRGSLRCLIRSSWLMPEVIQRQRYRGAFATGVGAHCLFGIRKVMAREGDFDFQGLGLGVRSKRANEMRRLAQIVCLRNSGFDEPMKCTDPLKSSAHGLAQETDIWAGPASIQPDALQHLHQQPRDDEAADVNFLGGALLHLPPLPRYQRPWLAFAVNGPVLSGVKLDPETQDMERRPKPEIDIPDTDG
ncbi:hypothetical protein NM208_g8997 [Fusarium decemcellulare]|uniref:Uncharacterized protein n=1 Tax=Fusarium decemcellulare TaxID=57161 RepID=A0ACC1S389_9HYPO|nr:hypothetical protein NM208_g8997 [Fusarium decemcellulare]